MKSWKTLLKAIAVGAMSGATIGLLAFVFLTSRQYPSMGAGLFLAAPIAAGFSIAIVSRKLDIMVASALLSVLCSLGSLIALGKEGVLCALLALPIVFAGLGIGVGIGVLARKLFLNRAGNHTTMTGMLLLVAPALIFTGERVERPMLQQARTEVISTTMEVNDSPERVWGHILSIDSVKASKPILMYVGLPVSQRCTMQGQGVGAKRTCYFDVGYIEETVSEWKPPYNLGLAIDRTHMPDRHWLGFESADYRLEPEGNMTRITRTTTVSSHLHPSWYWRPFERLGVESEHIYILRDLALRARR